MRIRFETLEPGKRPVNATADHFEVTNVASVEVVEAKDRSVTLLFDPEHNLEDRILSEQFKT